MTKYEKLEIITNGINAANKIRTLQSSVSNQRADDPNNVDQVGLISQMLGILTQYSPNTHRKNCLMKIWTKPGCTAKYTEDSSMK